ncbi:MAG: hypothetical protein NC218_08115 [Acetobacter sp.]|nr:hypothetical protein [Acetobacter sp.]
MLAKIVEFYLHMVTFGHYTNLAVKYDVEKASNKSINQSYVDEQNMRMTVERHLHQIMQENEALRYDKSNLTVETEAQAKQINELLLNNSELRAEIAQMKVNKEKAEAFDIIRKELKTTCVGDTVEKVHIYNEEIKSRKKLNLSINLLKAIDSVKLAYEALNGSLYEERKGI